MNPLSAPCLHVPSPEEQQRDPAYTGCSAAIYSPCVWAKRYDGTQPPRFHSERIEAAAASEAKQVTDADFDRYVLASGLV